MLLYGSKQALSSSIASPVNAFPSAIAQMTLQYILVRQNSSTHIIVIVLTAKAGPQTAGYAGLYVPHSGRRRISRQ